MIRTVLGDVGGGALGHIQCHEHLFLEKGPSCQSNPALLMEDTGRTAAELADYRSAGGGCVLDAQPGFCGRMAKRLVDASAQTGVSIIATTGFHKRAFYPKNSPVFALGREEAARLFCSEVTEGMISETGERIHAQAGVIKIAFGSDGGTGLDPLLTGAAIDAAAATGAPVLVHTEKDCDILALLDALLQGGVAPNRVIVCHLDRTCRDLKRHLAVLETGAFLDYDSINRPKHLSDDEECHTISYGLEHGYEKQLLLSLDTTNRRLRHYGGSMGLDYILTTFLPMLARRGVTQRQLSLLTHENAVRALTMRRTQAYDFEEE